MSKNRIRGTPKKKANRVRDSDIVKKIRKDIEELVNRVIRYILKNKKKLLPYIIFAYIGDKLSYSYRMSKETNPITRLTDTINSLGKIIKSPLYSFNIKDILTGIIMALILRLMLYIKLQDAKNYRKGEEYGSASFGSAKDIEPFIDWEHPYNNLLLSATERLSMNPRMKDPTANRNKNILIVGGSGSGKTRGHVKPNIMQMFGSFIITDPKGSVIYEVGDLLRRAGYRIKVLNTIDFKKSMHFNPFAKIKKETDIMKMVDAFVAGTTTGKQQGEQFWIDAEKLLYNALIAYILKVGLEEEKNFATMLDMINHMEIRDDDDSYKNAVDLMFEDLEQEDPECYAVLQYKKFKQAAGVINYKRFLIQSFERQQMAA